MMDASSKFENKTKRRLTRPNRRLQSKGKSVFTRIILPIIASVGLALAIFTVVQARQGPQAAKPRETPPTRPIEISGKEQVVAGAGLIEARRENVPIGTPVPGVVTDVLITHGAHVTAGQPLFKIDTRDLEAQLRVNEAKAAVSRAELARLREDPYSLDVPPAEEAVEEARARLDDARIILDRAEKLFRRDAGTASEYDSARTKAVAEQAALRKADAELARARVKAATYDEQIAIAEARLAEAEAVVEQTKIEIERHTIRAQVDGVVLQLNVRPGQYAAMIWKEPLVVLGDTGRLHVRVDIDEQDLAAFDPQGQAIATLKGKPQIKFELTPVRVDPYVIPKRSLTGDNSERVDTRVLQVIYALPQDATTSLYVGQQMDIYTKARGMKQATDQSKLIQATRSP
jgi:HlyD family secretion protein